MFLFHSSKIKVIYHSSIILVGPMSLQGSLNEEDMASQVPEELIPRELHQRADAARPGAHGRHSTRDWHWLEDSLGLLRSDPS